MVDRVLAWLRDNSLTATPYVVPCWIDLDHSARRDACCSGARSDCFDHVYSREECCSAAGSAVIVPMAAPDAVGIRGLLAGPSAWRRPLRGAGAAAVPVARAGARHPAFSVEQRRFERLHAAATTFRRVEVLDEELLVADFKTSKKVDIITDELKSDPYGFRQLVVGRRLAGGTATPTFLDVGANIGLVSLLLAKMFPLAQVVAVEPVPELFRYLLWSLKLNNLTDRVWALNAGLGGDACDRDGAIYELAEASLWWLPEAALARGSCLSFADVLAAVVEVDLLKLDCEGCEYQALASPAVRRLASQRVRHIAGEAHGCCEGEVAAVVLGHATWAGALAAGAAWVGESTT